VQVNFQAYVGNKGAPFWVQDLENLRCMFDELLALRREGYPVMGGERQFQKFWTSFADPPHEAQMRHFDLAGEKRDYDIGLRSMFIYPNGDVFFCDFLQQPIGNIHQNSLSDIYCGAGADSERKQMIYRDIDCQQTCRRATPLVEEAPRFHLDGVTENGPESAEVECHAESTAANRLTLSPHGQRRGARTNRRPRVLVFAYACEPDRGSEPGAGWGLVRTLATFADCTVLVGSEHRAGIARWEAEHASAALQFVEVGDPWWTPHERRHRLTRFVVYLTWLRRAHATGLRLHRARPFDAVFHATYSTYWLPSPAVRYGVPCVWGPVGGAVVTPRQLRSVLGWRGMLSELLDFVAVRLFAVFPPTRRTMRKADVVLVQNEATRHELPPDVGRRALVLNHALFAEVPRAPWRRRSPHCLFVGPLESRKGVSLALRALAFAHADVELRIIGDGPERTALEKLAERLGLAGRVRFLGWAPRHEVLERMAGAAAVVFTGLREEGGIALAEALLLGTPVVVLAHGGARTVAESTVDRSRVVLVPPGDVAATARGIGEALSYFSQHPPACRQSMLNHDEAVRRFRAAVETAYGRGNRPAASNECRL
jgi:glycosyltransferase involved in cell wall biosynthesis